MTITHRTLDGAWAVCDRPEACKLLYHFPDSTPAGMACLPETFVWDLCNLLVPGVNYTAAESHSGLAFTQWVDTDGVQHRDYDLPAVMYENGVVAWIRHGEEHRDHDRPAVIYGDGDTRWYQHGEFHREAGPAIVFADGTQEWRDYGRLHRIGGPAVIGTDGTQEWYLDGQRHREDGPAIMESDGSGEWWQHGRSLGNCGP